LVDGFLAAHLSSDMHAPVFDQAVVADRIDPGRLTRQLRRMRVLHRERQQDLLTLAEPLGHALRRTASDGGLHLVGRLADGRAEAGVARKALRKGVHVWPLSTHHLGSAPGAALLLGYSGTTPEDMRHGIGVLADALT
jgi:GntR family transcriptional regulator/MocR family aminotransferase